MKVNISREGQRITMTDPATKISIQFAEGEELQLYQHNVICASEQMTTAEGVEMVSRTAEGLVKEAAQMWPKEFEELKC